MYVEFIILIKFFRHFLKEFLLLPKFYWLICYKINRNISFGVSFQYSTGRLSVLIESMMRPILLFVFCI